jgi:tRNA nucleotidyltransferase (CCA-adding enzyme)
VFDHHPEPTDPIPGATGLREDVGATVTLLCRRLEAEGVVLPPPLATLALLGLHEDTGDLTFDHVHPDDHRAAAWLLTQGANLDLVRRFRSGGTPPELRAARDRVVARPTCTRWPAAASRSAGGPTTATPTASAPSPATCSRRPPPTPPSSSPAWTARRWCSRAPTPASTSAAALQRALGGGGHARAAFARTTSTRTPPSSGHGRAARCVTPPTRARDIMSSPVVTVPEGARVAEARQALARHKHNGMPVVDDRRRAGRRDLAPRHRARAAPRPRRRRRVRLHDAPALTATPDATLASSRASCCEHDIGRVPIVVGEELVGIVTRTDLVRARHPRPPRRAPAERVWASLPEGAREVLDTAVARARRAPLPGGRHRPRRPARRRLRRPRPAGGGRRGRRRPRHRPARARRRQPRVHPAFGTATLSRCRTAW